ncbi:PREDICTED: RAB6-interacting golgin [Gavialis gangeticus]|uniref:RAB6-interacting golgin n=1 Tax=Gavialis gangeticus TaxID=94835 RepID=UPI00092F1DBE|nr:PREDICTED: RAB6-interacting golgin [Gavialis gangeticus]
MAGGWAGFSDQELRRLRGQRADPADPRDPPRRPPSAGKSRKQLQRERALQQQIQGPGLPPCAPPEQLLSVPGRRPRPPPGGPCPPAEPGQQDAGHPHKDLDLDSPNGTEDAPSLSAKLPEKKKVELQEKSRWEVLQQEQRLMEEKNKRKKALLAKAIAERSKRTQAETVKLKRIQKELQALDDMVSADIGILRNRIDQASVDYSYARKRYDKAESEYVAAKLDLQRKTEIKEHLTEHLCTIIQQNELRKAKKLEELMKQLEVEADEENLELEIEVERMLQQQETEAVRQTAQVQSPSQTGVENAAPHATAKENECMDHEASGIEQLTVQPGNSCNNSFSDMDNQNQTVNTTQDNSPACTDT